MWSHRQRGGGGGGGASAGLVAASPALAALLNPPIPPHLMQDLLLVGLFGVDILLNTRMAYYEGETLIQARAAALSPSSPSVLHSLNARRPCLPPLLPLCVALCTRAARSSVRLCAPPPGPSLHHNAPERAPGPARPHARPSPPSLPLSLPPHPLGRSPQDPAETTSHYLRTSFLLDLLGFLPLDWLALAAAGGLAGADPSTLGCAAGRGGQAAAWPPRRTTTD